MTIFVNGRQKRVRREPTFDGLPLEDFILQNADPSFLHQEGRWDILEERARAEREKSEGGGLMEEKRERKTPVLDDDFDIPF